MTDPYIIHQVWVGGLMIGSVVAAVMVALIMILCHLGNLD